MRPSRGMGAIMPSKMGKPKRKARRDDTDFTEYKEGGTVNKAGNYTKPSMRKALFNKIKASATHGTGAGQWSARKAQLLAKKYKAAGVDINEWFSKISAFFKGLGRPEVDNQVREEVVRNRREIPAKKGNRSPKPTRVRSNNTSKTARKSTGKTVRAPAVKSKSKSKTLQKG